MDRSADRIARKRDARKQALEAVAGNGLIDRRALLGRGVVLAGALGAGIAPSAAGAEPLTDDPWSLEIGEADAALSNAIKVRGQGRAHA